MVRLVGDFDDDVVVMIGDTPLPPRLFDYFHPLVVTGAVSFYRGASRIKTVPCASYAAPADSDADRALAAVVAYPDNVFIDYSRGVVLRHEDDSKILWETIAAP